MSLPKNMLCIKNGEVIVRPIAKFITSESHMDYGIAGPLQALPYLEQGEFTFYDSEGKTHIAGGWDDRKIFVDGGKDK